MPHERAARTSRSTPLLPARTRGGGGERASDSSPAGARPSLGLPAMRRTATRPSNATQRATAAPAPAHKQQDPQQDLRRQHRDTGGSASASEHHPVGISGRGRDGSAEARNRARGGRAEGRREDGRGVRQRVLKAAAETIGRRADCEPGAAEQAAPDGAARERKPDRAGEAEQKGTEEPLPGAEVEAAAKTAATPARRRMCGLPAETSHWSLKTDAWVPQMDFPASARAAPVGSFGSFRSTMSTPTSSSARSIKRERFVDCSGSACGSACGSGEERDTPRKYKRRRKWNAHEDVLLRSVVAETQQVHERISWSVVAQRIPTRTPKQCRDRWNSITPGVKKKEWTEEEDRLLLRLHDKYQNSWVRISKEFQGRNDNMLKSRFRSLTKQIKRERLAQASRGDASSNPATPASCRSPSAASTPRSTMSEGTATLNFPAEHPRLHEERNLQDQHRHEEQENAAAFHNNVTSLPPPLSLEFLEFASGTASSSSSSRRNNNNNPLETEDEDDGWSASCHPTPLYSAEASCDKSFSSFHQFPAATAAEEAWNRFDVSQVDEKETTHKLQHVVQQQTHRHQVSDPELAEWCAVMVRLERDE